MNAIDDKVLAKALTMMVDEYGSQNYGCAWCSHVGPKAPHDEACPITVARAAIKTCLTSRSIER